MVRIVCTKSYVCMCVINGSKLLIKTRQLRFYIDNRHCAAFTFSSEWNRISRIHREHRRVQTMLCILPLDKLCYFLAENPPFDLCECDGRICVCPRYAYTQPFPKENYFMLNIVMAHKGIQFRITGDFLTAPLLLVIAERKLFVNTPTYCIVPLISSILYG